MAIDTERLQDLRQRLDIARKKIDSELDKGAARDKELVASFERHVEDLRKELEALTHARASKVVCEIYVCRDIAQSCTSQCIWLVDSVLLQAELQCLAGATEVECVKH